ncbi:helix-turn-helix transcriptional regulator [Roseospirillum parvum]|uniref:DNA-binding transcriptional regulator, CsgD family n=1 Tax=Roseospirillum parvum TaxID=83401 RepID=A0A1G7TK74_9PROT|nr:helix-turn-helix transcriptional regulator [Roseospirillum parvum]SDG35601.1 DNA-binding transcriptional regulator, CsgD family [Roseospirillum parvum]
MSETDSTIQATPATSGKPATPRPAKPRGGDKAASASRCLVVAPAAATATALRLAGSQAPVSVYLVRTVEAAPDETFIATVLVADDPTLVMAARRRVAAPVVVVADRLDVASELELLRHGAMEVLAASSSGPEELWQAVARARVRQQSMLANQPAGSHAAPVAPPGANQASEALTLVDRLPLALILARANGTMIHANTPARRLLDTGDALTLDAGGILRAATSADSRRLSGIIRAVAEGAGDGEGALTLERPDSETPLSVIVVPAGRPGQGVALFVSDPDSLGRITEGRLSALYGLSGAEARLVNGLVQGRRLEDLADEQKVSPHTLRSQLKTVFRKTGVRRQSELVKLILTGPAVVGAATVAGEAPPDSGAFSI